MITWPLLERDHCSVIVGMLHTPSRGSTAPTILRDEHGNYLGSSTLVIPAILDPSTLEAIACRDALSSAEDLLLQSFIIALDSKQLVGVVLKGNQGRYETIISEIQHQASSFNFHFTFESPESNKEAHNLGQECHAWPGKPMTRDVFHTLWSLIIRTYTHGEGSSPITSRCWAGPVGI
jgi:hypothetical protein